MKFLHKTRPGVSLLIALVLTGVIVLFSTIVANVVITSIRQAANLNRSNEAYYAAEGGLEDGLLEHAKNGAGFTGALTENGYKGCDMNGANCATKGTYKVQGQVPPNTVYMTFTNYNGYYGIPRPGTGNAEDGCDPIQKIVDGEFDYDPVTDKYTLGTSGPYDATDHPCNWNKISFGQTVTVPLYVAGWLCPDNPGDVCNPSDLGLGELILRVRTPCEDGSGMCDAAGRYDLDTSQGDEKVGFDDTIIDWQILGQNKGGDKGYVMVPLRDYDFNNCGGRCEPDLNSEVYESLINGQAMGSGYTDGEVFNISAAGEGGDDISVTPKKRGFIFKFLMDISPWDMAGLRPLESDEIHQPVLKLTVISPLKNLTDHGKVPYLEYQILTDIDTSPADTAATIRAEGFSGPFKMVLEAKAPQESGLLEYVIQQ